ncbi:MAG: lipoyl(octanoyl) transferase LipB [Anaerolineae bacterium]|nr:lipoyl(octanoyl) transferase LipB [Anaerolineae bacterium]
MNNLCQRQWLGQLGYQRALELQKELVAKRTVGEIPDTLLFLEHPPTYTLGADAHRGHLLISQQEMARLNIAYYTADRGGPIFFHCPGQLVVYPILKLGQNCYNYHDYIKLIESVIIRALSFFEVRAFRQPGQGGIWVLSGTQRKYSQFDSAVAKIGAVGVKVNRANVTSHGFWINVNPSLQYFDLIMPGGVKDGHITSLHHVLNEPIEVGAVIEPVLQAFCQIFALEPLSLTTPAPTSQNFSWRTPKLMVDAKFN